MMIHSGSSRHCSRRLRMCGLGFTFANDSGFWLRCNEKRDFAIVSEKRIQLWTLMESFRTTSNFWSVSSPWSIKFTGKKTSLRNRICCLDHAHSYCTCIVFHKMCQRIMNFLCTEYISGTFTCRQGPRCDVTRWGLFLSSITHDGPCFRSKYTPDYFPSLMRHPYHFQYIWGLSVPLPATLRSNRIVEPWTTKCGWTRGAKLLCSLLKSWSVAHFDFWSFF